MTCKTLRHPQLSHQKPKIEMGWFRKTLWRDLLSNGRTTDSWKFYTSRNTASVYQKGQREPNESKLLDPQNSIGRKHAGKTTQLQRHVTFHEKERMAQKMEPQAQTVEPRTQQLELRAPEDYRQGLKSHGVCLVGFLHFEGPMTLFPFYFLPFWARIAMPVLPLYFGST